MSLLKNDALVTEKKLLINAFKLINPPNTNLRSILI